MQLKELVNTNVRKLHYRKKPLNCLCISSPLKKYDSLKDIFNPCSIHIYLQMGFQLDYMIHNYPPIKILLINYAIGN